MTSTPTGDLTSGPELPEPDSDEKTSNGSVPAGAVTPEPVRRRGRPALPDPGRTLLWTLGLIVVVALLTNLGRRLHAGDADVATIVMQGKSVVDGHPTLSGWSMVYDSFWTVEVPLYSIGVGLFGVQDALMYVIPAVVATATILLAAWMARGNLRGRASLVPVLTVVALIGIPSGVWALVLLRGGWHIASVFYCLVAFIGLRSGRHGAGWWLAVLLMGIGLNGDLQILAYGVMPMVGAGIVAMLRTRAWRGGVWTLAAAPAAVVVAYLWRQAADIVGTYSIGEGNPGASTDQRLENLRNVPSWLVQVSGAGGSRFGLYDVPAWLAAVHVVTVLVVAAAVIAGVVRTLRGMVTGDARADARTADADAESAVARTNDWRLEDLLVMACLADLAFFVYATLGNDPGYLRYLMPFLVFGAVLAGRDAARLAPRIPAGAPRVTVAAVAAAVVVLYGAATVINSVRDAPPSRTRALAAYLKQQGLARGIGTYWIASLTTVESDGAVMVSPVIGNKADGRLVRYNKQSTDAWYRPAFRFLVFENGTTWPGVSEAAAVRTFGPVAKKLTPPGFTVLVWDHDVRMSPTEMSG